jgi:hypothetical protein
MNYKISHPWVAFSVVFILAAVLSQYGIVQGSLLLFDLFAGVAIYKWATHKL